MHMLLKERLLYNNYLVSSLIQTYESERSNVQCDETCWKYGFYDKPVKNLLQIWCFEMSSYVKKPHLSSSVLYPFFIMINLLISFFITRQNWHFLCFKLIHDINFDMICALFTIEINHMVLYLEIFVVVTDKKKSFCSEMEIQRRKDTFDTFRLLVFFKTEILP